MTCAHVLGLIDAGPFADYPRAHLDAAWQHARQCETCGAALDSAIPLTKELAALPQPMPPPGLAAVVLARIAQIEAQAPARKTAALKARRPSFGVPEWSAWATISGGLVALVAMVLSMPPGGVAPIDIASLGVRGMPSDLFAMPAPTSWALVLAVGLVLYGAGLFAPLGGKRLR